MRIAVVIILAALIGAGVTGCAAPVQRSDACGELTAAVEEFYSWVDQVVTAVSDQEKEDAIRGYVSVAEKMRSVEASREVEQAASRVASNIEDLLRGAPASASEEEADAAADEAVAALFDSLDQLVLVCETRGQ